MGLFSALFRKPITVEDEVFGLMTFMPHRKYATKSYFESGPMQSASAAREIQCFIDADIQGPSPEQRSFYQWIEANYYSLSQKLIPIIEDEFQNWKPGLAIQDFGAEFWLTGITIPRLDAKPVEWDWSFETVHDVNHMLTIYMCDDVPQSGVQFDG